MTPAALTGVSASEEPRRDASPKVLEKALRILDLFTAERPAWTATEIARTLEITVPTAHRLARTLERHAYLARGEHNAFRLGMAAQDLGARAAASMDLGMALRPILQQLAKDSGETVVLSVCDKRRLLALCVDRVETDHALRLSIDIGRLSPLNAGAASKTLLAYLDESAIEAVLSAPLPKRTDHTVTDAARLRDELVAIREQGYAYSYEETDVGAWGISAPILTAEERLIASIGIVAPTPRHSAESRAHFVDLVLTAARTASDLLDPRRAAS